MIIFDYNIFFLQKFGGISRYFVELCKQMSLNQIDYHIQSAIHQNYYLNEASVNKSYNIYLKEYPRFTRRFITSINKYFFYRNINRNNHKIFHNTYYGNFKLNKNITQISTIYDFTHEIFSKQYNYKENIKIEAIKNSNHLICISENTKKDLIKFYNIKSKDVSVVYLGGDHLPKANKILKDKPFILYVGYRENYKNFDILLKTFYSSPKLKKDFDIICFGGSQFNDDEINKISKYGLTDLVKYISGDDQKLSDLYASASCHVITSKYEGFGITAIEAYNFGCPVIHTGKGSLAEVADMKSQYDGTYENLKFILEKFLYSNQDMKELSINTKKIKNKFTWANCFNNTHVVYKKFL
jgi:glycosyltransferase involved in cell wall biosynthesis